MTQHHKWDHDALMNMIPWEREVKIALTHAYVKEENEKKKLARQAQR
jgi:hypothetical protein